MEREICEAKLEKPTAYNDERFKSILRKAREIKGLICELDEITNHKLNELLGAPPQSPCNDTCKTSPESWADRVIDEQDIALSTVREILERMSMV